MNVDFTRSEKPKRVGREPRHPPVHPFSQNKTYSKVALANICRRNTAPPVRGTKFLAAHSQLDSADPLERAKRGIHNSALNSLIPYSRLLRASEISESCCLGHVWRQLLNFRTIWKISDMQKTGMEKQI